MAVLSDWRLEARHARRTDRYYARGNAVPGDVQVNKGERGSAEVQFNAGSRRALGIFDGCGGNGSLAEASRDARSTSGAESFGKAFPGKSAKPVVESRIARIEEMGGGHDTRWRNELGELV